MRSRFEQEVVLAAILDRKAAKWQKNARKWTLTASFRRLWHDVRLPFHFFYEVGNRM